MNPAVHARRVQIFDHDLNRIRCGADRLIAGLMILQWLAGIVVAAVVSPLTWRGVESALHIHLPAAVLLGGLLALAPVTLAFLASG